MIDIKSVIEKYGVENIQIRHFAWMKDPDVSVMYGNLSGVVPYYAEEAHSMYEITERNYKVKDGDMIELKPLSDKFDYKEFSIKDFNNYYEKQENNHYLSIFVKENGVFKELGNPEEKKPVYVAFPFDRPEKFSVSSALDRILSRNEIKDVNEPIRSNSSRAEHSPFR